MMQNVEMRETQSHPFSCRWSFTDIPHGHASLKEKFVSLALRATLDNFLVQVQYFQCIYFILS